MTEWF